MTGSGRGKPEKNQDKMEIAINDRDGKEYLSYAKTFKVCTDGHELLIYETEDKEIAICEIGKKGRILVRPRADNTIHLA